MRKVAAAAVIAVGGPIQIGGKVVCYAWRGLGAVVGRERVKVDWLEEEWGGEGVWGVCWLDWWEWICKQAWQTPTPTPPLPIPIPIQLQRQ